MTARHSPRCAGALLGIAAALLLAGCGPVPVGLTAVSQRDGHLLIAVMRCDDTALERAAITHAGPFKTEGPRDYIDDGRWTTDQDDEDIVILDTSRPGEAWSTVKSLGRLDAAVTYSAHAGGDSDHPMGNVGFTTAEFGALAEGQWLYNSGDNAQEGVVRPTTTDLADLREKNCH